MKYIMFECKEKETDEVSVLFPIIFPKNFVHRFVAQGLIPILRQRHGYDYVAVRSAGDYNPMTGVCSGSSETLAIGVHEDDTTYIPISDYVV